MKNFCKRAFQTSAAILLCADLVGGGVGIADELKGTPDAHPALQKVAGYSAMGGAAGMILTGPFMFGSPKRKNSPSP